MRLVLLTLLLLIQTPLWASEDNFGFEDPARRELFLKLTQELRCPMCQNQNIADSDAMIAHDMRRKVYHLLQEGKSEDDVIKYMKDRYGDFVYYKPPVTVATVWLWLAPVLFAFVAIVLLLRQRKTSADEQDVAAKLAKAEKMLEQDK